MRSDLGSSLLEVLIALMVMALVLTSLASAVMVGLKSAELARQKTRATFLATEGQEWLKGQRLQYGWPEFATMGDSNGRIYCLNVLPVAVVDLVEGVCAADQRMEGIYERMVTITTKANEQVEVVVAVDWGQLKGGSTESLKAQTSTSFSYWEQQTGAGDPLGPPPLGDGPQTCYEYCVDKGIVLGGTCRGKPSNCSSKEQYFSGGDGLCVQQFSGNGKKDTCCCKMRN